MSDPSINTFINVLVGGMVADNLLRQDFSRLRKRKFLIINTALLVILQEAIYDYLTEYYYPNTTAMNCFDLIQSYPKLYFWYVLFGTVIQRTMSFRGASNVIVNKYISWIAQAALYVAIVLRFIMYCMEWPGVLNLPSASDPTLNAVHDAFDTISVTLSVLVPLAMNALFLVHFSELYGKAMQKGTNHIAFNFIIAFLLETLFNILTFVNQIYTAANLDQPMHRISNVAIGIIGINLLRFGSDMELVLRGGSGSEDSSHQKSTVRPANSIAARKE
ncbi:hypothetical protein HDV04_003866 [Boothiomyces sp. JEL0838]|nr:hypothetical protein HDV04_003866 [Boothiomyces sp. JEL0838]